MKCIFAFALAARLIAAQEIHEMIHFDSLKSKAEETVEVNLDGNLLKLAMSFLNDKDPDQAAAKRLIGGVKGIYVRSLSFKQAGMYDASDIEKIRALVKGPEWSKAVNVESSKKNGDNVGVFIRTDGSQMSGLLVLSFEPKEVTVVNIVGVIDPAQIRELGGKLGIPEIWDDGKKSKKNRQPNKDEEEEER